jgi:hypothetical protein
MITITVDENSSEKSKYYANKAKDSADDAKNVLPLDSISPGEIPDGVGLKSWNAVAPGPYPNCGGIVIPENCFAIIKRSASGSFSFSKTNIELGAYAKKTDLQNIDLTEYAKESIKIYEQPVIIDGAINNLNSTNVIVAKKILNKGYITNFSVRNFNATSVTIGLYTKNPKTIASPSESGFTLVTGSQKTFPIPTNSWSYLDNFSIPCLEGQYLGFITNGIIYQTSGGQIGYYQSSNLFSTTTSNLNLNASISFIISDFISEIATRSDATRINNWSSKPYLKDSQVNYIGEDWYASEDVLSTEVPSISPKWVNRLSGYDLIELFKLSTNTDDVRGLVTNNIVMYRSIERNGFINKFSIRNYSGSFVTIGLYTKNPKTIALPNETGFTLVVGSEITFQLNGAGWNYFENFSIPCLEGQYFGFKNNNESYEGGSTVINGYYRSSDNLVTSSLFTNSNASISYSVADKISKLTIDLENYDIKDKFESLKYNVDANISVYNPLARTQVSDSNVNGVPAYGCRVPIHKSGIIDSIYFDSGNIRNQRRILIVRLINQVVTVIKVIDCISLEDLNKRNIKVELGDYVVVDHNFGGIRIKASNISNEPTFGVYNYQSIPFNLKEGDALTYFGTKEGVFSLILSININTIDKKISETSTIIPKSVTSFNDDFSKENKNWVATGWAFDYTNKRVTNTALGISNMLRLDLQYHSTRKKGRFIVSFSDLTTIFHYNSGTNYGSHYIIDLANQKIQMTNGSLYTTIAVESIANIIANRDYLVEIELVDTTQYLRLFDTLTGEKTELTVQSAVTGINYQSGSYQFYLESGTATIKSFNVSIAYKPYLVFVGDSNTTGTGISALSKAFARKIKELLPTKVVISSALPGATIATSFASFPGELEFSRPKYIHLLIGTNSNPGYSVYYIFNEFCKVYGIKCIISYVMCKGTTNGHIAVNNSIGNLFNGVRFDLASAINNNPVGATTGSEDRRNLSLYSDLLHLNDAGHAEVIKRFYIDVPFLFEN